MVYLVVTGYLFSKKKTFAVLGIFRSKEKALAVARQGAERGRYGDYLEVAWEKDKLQCRVYAIPLDRAGNWFFKCSSFGIEDFWEED